MIALFHFLRYNWPMTSWGLRNVSNWYFLGSVVFIGDRLGRSFFWTGQVNSAGPFSFGLENSVMIYLMALVLAGLIFCWHLFVGARPILFLIFLAGLNNLIDRLWWGGVIDYLPWFGVGYFNLSDAMLLFTLAYFLILLMPNSKFKIFNL